MAGHDLLDVHEDRESIRPSREIQHEDQGRNYAAENEEMTREREEAEEGVGPRVTKAPDAPTADEVREHNIDHGVFRAWCPHCVSVYQSRTGTE